MTTDIGDDTAPVITSAVVPIAGVTATTARIATTTANRARPAGRGRLAVETDLRNASIDHPDCPAKA
jgi:hypothetical protein